MQEVIGAALDRLSAPLQERPVTVVAPPELPMIPVDFVLIVQVLVNLLDNALKYSPPARRSLSAPPTGGDLEIAVADQGIGIPPQDLVRVFDKFYRVHRPDGVSGTGLGLSICKGIVEAHGGRIWAENRAGGGAVITLALPLARPSED